MRWLLPLALTGLYLRYILLDTPSTPISYAVGPCFIAGAILWALRK